MSWYSPGSQSRVVLEEKQQLAARLLNQGLTVTQICAQLRCSPQFVRRVRSQGSELRSQGPGHMGLGGSAVG